MRHVLFVSAIAILSVMAGCKKANTYHGPSNHEPALRSEVIAGKKHWIAFATWDSWGHGDKCGGWGLCRFMGCAFCCTDDKETTIIKCNDKSQVERAGRIDIEEGETVGEMTISLDPVYPDQKEAIGNQAVFYIDEDLSDETFILHSGEYKFDPTVGLNGGYRILVSLR